MGHLWGEAARAVEDVSPDQEASQSGGMVAMVKEFRDFILRGNVVDLAVAVVIGTAFKAIVDALVKDLITPLIAAIGGQPDFSAVKFTINGSQFLIGDFINVIISFLIIAAVIFFLVVKPMNIAMARAARTTEVAAPPAPTKEEVLLTEIRDALRAPTR
jgi:large conductance mechanosensitive channel